MDYTKHPLSFKIRKALRYISLYGILRTLIKIQGQYHMRRNYQVLPRMDTLPRRSQHVGLIGCGNFAYSSIAYYLNRNHGNVIRAAMDIDINRAASLYEKYRLSYYTDDSERIIKDPDIDVIFIASNHASHAEYAIQALKQGKNVHIEKPHVVNEDQLNRLCAAMATSSGRVWLGFNRPGSAIGKVIKAALDTQSGIGVQNWFVAGHALEGDHWYFREDEGGRVLGNLCHWTDFVYQMVDADCRFPIAIHPTRGTQSDSNICVSYVFGDGSIAAITFSAMGHTFEGVRERYSAHRGNVLISMDDFKSVVVEDADKKQIYRNAFREHGHESNIMASYHGAAGKTGGCTRQYVWETGYLFLKTREALEADAKVVIANAHVT